MRFGVGRGESKKSSSFWPRRLFSTAAFFGRDHFQFFGEKGKGRSLPAAQLSDRGGGGSAEWEGVRGLMERPHLVASRRGNRATTTTTKKPAAS